VKKDREFIFVDPKVPIDRDLLLDFEVKEELKLPSFIFRATEDVKRGMKTRVFTSYFHKRAPLRLLTLYCT
jgi:hypothetical protein